jgi:hypothetical protein
MSLIEIMVAMFLLTVIMLGLFSAFYQTQRAFRLSASQTDVLEGGRSLLSLVVRELQETTASDQLDGVNLFATTPIGAVDLPLPGGGMQTNHLQDFFFLKRKNDVWTGVGYFVTVKGQGVGTLYRFSATNEVTNSSFRLASLFQAAQGAQPGGTNVGRVAEGLVHLTVRAFDTNGIEYVPPHPWLLTNGIGVTVWNGGYMFTNRMLPAFLDVELGTVDAQVYRQYMLIASNSLVAGRQFLENQAGKVYLFRQRIPIRNYHEP